MELSLENLRRSLPLMEWSIGWLLTSLIRGVKSWQAVVPRAGTSNAVSSTTVQGYLPQYAGFAAKSLSPSMDKARTSHRDALLIGSPSSSILDDGSALMTPILVKQDNSRLKNGEGSLEEQFRNVVSMDVADRANLSSTFIL